MTPGNSRRSRLPLGDRRPTTMPTQVGLMRAALRMLITFAGCVLVARGADSINAPVEIKAIPLALGFLYVVRVGHYAVWPRTPPRILTVLPLLVVLLLTFIASLLGAVVLAMTAVVSPEAAVGLVTTLATLYLLLWWLRSLLVDNPRLLAARYLLWFLLVISLTTAGAYALGLDVEDNNVDQFYGTAGQADAALLLAAAFQSAWARYVRALEGVVLVTVSALALSLTCCLIALGSGADNSTLLAFTVAGLVSGFVLVAIGVARQVAPDLLEDWGPRGEERLIAEQLGRQDWYVTHLGSRRGRGYDLKAERGNARIYVAVSASVVWTQPTLTQIQWKRAKRYGRSYVLAVVDYFGSEEQSTWYVRDPAATVTAIERAVSPPRLHRPWLEPSAVKADRL